MVRSMAAWAEPSATGISIPKRLVSEPAFARLLKPCMSRRRSKPDAGGRSARD